MNAIPKKIFTVGHNGSNYDNWIPGVKCYTIETADIVLFTGGVDINPALYGKKANPKNQIPSAFRDSEELEAFEKAYAQKKFMIGICRGAQFLCAMAGGILVQHQQHPQYHELITKFGKINRVSSDHHQRAHPFNLPDDEYELLGWTQGLSPFNEGESPEDIITSPDNKEAEVVWYPKIRALGIQAHPEWQYHTDIPDDLKAIDWFKSLVYKYQDMK